MTNETSALLDLPESTVTVIVKWNHASLSDFLMCESGFGGSLENYTDQNTHCQMFWCCFSGLGLVTLYQGNVNATEYNKTVDNFMLQTVWRKPFSDVCDPLHRLIHWMWASPSHQISRKPHKCSPDSHRYTPAFHEKQRLTWQQKGAQLQINAQVFLMGCSTSL